MMRRGHLMSMFVGGWMVRCAAAPACKVRSAAMNSDALLPGWSPLVLPCCCGLVSRSRGLRCPSDLERVVSSMVNITIEAAQVIGINELGKLGAVKRTVHFVDHFIANYGAVLHQRREMLEILWRYWDCVTFFGAAGNDLLITIAGPHDGILEVTGIQRVRTLHLGTGTSWRPYHRAFEVYSVENGVDKIMNSDYTTLSEFILCALTAFEKQAERPITAHEIVCPSTPRNDRTFLVDRTLRFVASSESDWNVLLRTTIDLSRSNFVDLKLPQTWSIDANVAVLIGGESGSGKTSEMISGHRDKSDLIIYMRFPVEALDASFYAQQCDIITDNDNMIQSIATKSTSLSAADLEELVKARVQRNDAFTGLAVAAVKVAVNDSRAVMKDVLAKLTTREKFTVRLCFDDMGDRPAFVRALCAMDTSNLREKLKWDPQVEIFVVAAGSGIGTFSNPENFCQLAILTDTRASNGASVYWRMRERKCDDRWTYASFFRNFNVTALKENWHDHRQRDEKLQQRNKALSRMFKANAVREHESGHPHRDTSIPLMEEALLAAVESDRASAAAIGNPRMAMLIMREVDKITEQILDDKVGAAASGTHIGRVALQRAAARLFTEHSAVMKCDTSSDVGAQLVESLRYVLFDGYASPIHSAHMLAGHGILIDNAKYERDVPKECAVVLGYDGTPRTMTIKSRASKSGVVYTACYPKDVGRYSISPAMIVALSTSMTGVFEECFTNTDDGFGHNMAKFLYLAVHVFHGRPARELVDFVVGSSAIVGTGAQKILDGSTKIDFQSLTLRRMCGDMSHARGAEQCSAARNVSSVTRGTTQDDGGNASCSMWIEINPASLPNADVALHIPGVITIHFGCMNTLGKAVEQNERMLDELGAKLNDA
ncbi:Hypothetical protein, putative, partial [Bodo saltans]